MKWAALIAWVITALGGFGLLSIWLRNGGLAAGSRPGTRIRAPRVFSHMGLAAIGLVLWIIYVAADKDAIAWACSDRARACGDPWLLDARHLDPAATARTGHCRRAEP